MMFFFWLPLLLLFIWLISRSGGRHWPYPDHPSSPPTPQETPLDILKKRYARGEITKAQFDEMKKDL